MKKNTLHLFFSILFLSLLTACGSTTSDNDRDDCPDTLWDFANYQIVFIATDSETGANLFDPKNPDNLLDGGVWVTYKDKIFDVVDWQYSENGTRANLSRPFALRYYPIGMPYPYPNGAMAFGEFSPGGYRNEPFVIHWADDTSDRVELDCYITWENCQPTIHKALYLNGEMVSEDTYPTLSFIKKGMQPQETN